MFARLRAFGRRFGRGAPWGEPVLRRWRWGLGIFLVPAVGIVVFRGTLLGWILFFSIVLAFSDQEIDAYPGLTLVADGLASLIALVGMVLSARWIARLGREGPAPPTDD